MSKREKTKDQKEKKSKQPPAQPGKARLVALDGTRGALLLEEAERVAGQVRGGREPAWSRWDASNTFYELRLGKTRNLNPTPRILLLLYASDLLFRLRWEIEPAIKEGRSVVAAPYVETAVAFGLAADLPKDWLDELFRFAPKADLSLRLKEKKKAKKAKNKKPDALAGFLEFCCATLARNGDWRLEDLRVRMLGYLEELEQHGALRRLGKKV